MIIVSNHLLSFISKTPSRYLIANIGAINDEKILSFDLQAFYVRFYLYLFLTLINLHLQRHLSTQRSPTSVCRSQLAVSQDKSL